MSYRIYDKDWESDASLSASQAEHRGSELLAIDQYNAVEFYDQGGQLFYRYRLPESRILFSGIRHYFRYFHSDYAKLEPISLKFRMIQATLNSIRKINSHRPEVSVLDIGCTLGETYLILRDALRLEPRRTRLDYVGLDIEPDYIAVARDLFAGDPHFHAIRGEGSDLSRFPDRSFDLVISNGVHNHLHDQERGIKEAFRASRIAALLHMYLSDAETDLNFMSAINQSIRYTAPTWKTLMRYVGSLDRPVYMYLLSKDWKWRDRIDGTPSTIKYIADGKIRNWQLRWHMIVLARVPIFPELPKSQKGKFL